MAGTDPHVKNLKETSTGFLCARDDDVGGGGVGSVNRVKTGVARKDIDSVLPPSSVGRLITPLNADAKATPKRHCDRRAATYVPLCAGTALSPSVTFEEGVHLGTCPDVSLQPSSFALLRLVRTTFWRLLCDDVEDRPRPQFGHFNPQTQRPSVD